MPTEDFFDDYGGNIPAPPDSSNIKTHCIYSCEEQHNYGANGPLGIEGHRDPVCRWYCFGDDLNPAKVLQDALAGVDAMKNQILDFVMFKNDYDNEWVINTLLPEIKEQLMGGKNIDELKTQLEEWASGLDSDRRDWVMNTLLPEIDDIGTRLKDNVVTFINSENNEWRQWIEQGMANAYSRTTEFGRKLGRGLEQGKALGTKDVMEWIGERIQEWINDNVPSPP